MSKYCEWCGGLMVCADCTPVKEVSRDLISRKAVVEMLKEEINKTKNQLIETEIEKAYFYGRQAGTETIYNKIQSMPGEID
jgi:hypothetical protein